MYKDYQKHLEVSRRNIKIWRKNNPEKVKEQRKRWATKYRELIKTKHAAYYKEHRAHYIAIGLINNKRRRAENRSYLWNLKNQPCTDCHGMFPPVCMDFDHRERKFKNISAMMAYSREQLHTEISKCDLVCANCHRIRTQERANERKRIMAKAA